MQWASRERSELIHALGWFRHEVGQSCASCGGQRSSLWPFLDVKQAASGAPPSFRPLRGPLECKAGCNWSLSWCALRVCPRGAQPFHGWGQEWRLWEPQDPGKPSEKKSRPSIKTLSPRFLAQSDALCLCTERDAGLEERKGRFRDREEARKRERASKSERNNKKGLRFKVKEEPECSIMTALTQIMPHVILFNMIDQAGGEQLCLLKVARTHCPPLPPCTSEWHWAPDKGALVACSSCCSKPIAQERALLC